MTPRDFPPNPAPHACFSPPLPRCVPNLGDSRSATAITRYYPLLPAITRAPGPRMPGGCAPSMPPARKLSHFSPATQVIDAIENP
jgi:hypothetical protein